MISTMVNDSTEFIAADDDNTAKNSILPHLYPPFVSYNDNNDNYCAIFSSSSSSSLSAPNDTKCARATNILIKDNGDKTSSSHNEYRSYDKTITTTTPIVNYSATTITTDINNSSTTSNTTTSSLSNEDLDSNKRQAFLERFPINRCSHVFNTKREMDEALENITWDTIFHDYGWGFTANGSGLVTLVMIRDDCKGVKKRDLKKYGVENVHYFNVISAGGRKTEYEQPVVDYFKSTCIFLDP